MTNYNARIANKREPNPNPQLITTPVESLLDAVAAAPDAEADAAPDPAVSLGFANAELAAALMLEARVTLDELFETAFATPLRAVPEHVNAAVVACWVTVPPGTKPDGIVA